MAPAEADGVELLGLLELRIGRERVEGVLPRRGRVVLFVDTHEHGGRLLARRGAVRLEGRLGRAGGHADLVGNGDVAALGGHVGEGQRRVCVRLGKLAEAERTHEHHRHFAARDGVPRAEFSARVNDAVGGSGVDKLPRPRIRDVDGGILAAHALPAEHPHQNGDELLARDGLSEAEAPLPHAVHQTVLCGLVDALPRPRVGGNVGVVCGERGGAQRKHEQKAQK